uniref:Selenoprotein W n=1 Tax=Balaenoptera musculus TaxID=9771 RepID=A0A8C0DYG9_BALMU
MAAGVVWVSPTLHPRSPFLGKLRVSPRGHLSPANTSPSPQCGEGTPQVTGFFEVLVAGKLVHSKKGGDGYVDTESKFLKLVAAIKAALAQA